MDISSTPPPGYYNIPIKKTHIARICTYIFQPHFEKEKTTVVESFQGHAKTPLLWWNFGQVSTFHKNVYRSCSRLSIHSIAFSIVYFQCAVLQRFKEAIFNEDETPQALKPVLLKLCSLYGLWSLETHLTTLYQGQFITSGDC